jgi:nicotinamidase/pyrazinamidase
MNIDIEKLEIVRVVYDRTVSHNVDPQNGFTPLCPDELPVPGGNLIGVELAKQNTKFKFKTLSRDIHPLNAIWIATAEKPQLTPIVDEKNVDVHWNAHCISGTYGAEILKELGDVHDFNFLVNKGVDANLHPYTGVYHDQEKTISTGLIEYYEKNDILSVVVGGLALNMEDTPLCAGSTIMDLSDAGFQVILNLSTTKSLGSEKGRIDFIDMLVNDYNVFLVDSVDDIEII